MADFDTIRKLASLATRTVKLCVAGELVDEHEQLDQQLAAAKAPTSLGDTSKLAIAEQIVAVEEQMREATVEFHLRALPSRAWSTVILRRPERGEEESAEDYEPRLFAWQAEMVSRTCVEPQMSVEQVGELVDLLHFRAWVELSTACYLLNMGEVDVPNSAAASDLIGTSEQM